MTHPGGTSPSEAGVREPRGRVWQGLAVLFCLLLATAMILNNQMAGEGVWFWYARAFQHGVRLYADLHLPLQPLFVLEVDGWMHLLGIQTWAYELPSLLHALLLCGVLGWGLRYSDWLRAQKAVLLAACFCLTVVGDSYRFDDYHVVSEACILAGIGTLLAIARTDRSGRQLQLCAACGVLSGLSCMTRLNDGTAMAVTATFCVAFLVKRRRIPASAVLLLSVVATMLLVVWLTGDTVQAWISNSMVHAMASKGGSGHFVATPLLLFWKAGKQMVRRAGVYAVLIAATVLTRWIASRWRRGALFIVVVRGVILAVVLLLCTVSFRSLMLWSFLDPVVLPAVVASYLLGMLALLRLLGWMKWFGPRRPAEILLLIPLAEWASSSASSSGDPLTQYYAPVAMLLVLLAVLIPYGRLSQLVRSEVFVWTVLICAFGCWSKWIKPYAWQNWINPPMFTHRVWYRHPVYGPLYIDRDLLAFSVATCGDIDQGKPVGAVQPSLLSLPYPYPNYFCATPPWHGYIQTYFDTTQRSTIVHLMAELNTAPPEWIIYQRQLGILRGAEMLYNHRQPLAQRDLDTLLMRKIATGQWRLVERRNYLPGDGWLVIQTHR